LWWLTVAHAVQFERSSLGAVHGWTSDGALVLEVVAQEHLYPKDGQTVDGPYEFAIPKWRYVVVLQGDQELHRWLVAKELPSFAPDSPLQTSEWTAWRNSHPLTLATQSREATHGVRLEVRSDGSPAQWQGKRFQVQEDHEGEDETHVTLGLSSAGEGFWQAHVHLVERPGAMVGVIEESLSAWWSADGRQVALVMERPEAGTMRGPTMPELDVVVSRAAPLVGVLAPKGVSTDKVATAIASLGVIQKGEAQTARDSSVVYYAAGYEADAKAIAAKVPGGATVAPMDWKGAQHVVVAVGASAR
jgi:hypothetical protein